MMKVGIFGGTFDPVHIGHLRTAEEIREQYLLDKVYFVPAYIPPHKRTREITDPVLRLKMLKRAVRGNKSLYASDIEIKNQGISYSINMIKIFQKRFEKLYFIIGIDAFLEIDTWYHYQEIFNYTDFIIIERPINRKTPANTLFPSDIRKKINRIDERTYKHISGNKIHLQRGTQLDISSTMIRDSASSGRSIKYLVPQLVERFIDEMGLYRRITN
ncbi:MAG: nicotinate-nucleotide adenylyltransferase [Proteobacteria bacterium]|nr:nicotinate-nucleotide adenylyltransferase [Pseudomonadota bacterium]